MAELMATIFRFCATTNGSLTYFVGWNSNRGLSSMKSNSRRVPRTKLATSLAGWMVFCDPFMTPFSMSGITPSLNISVCMPRSRWLVRNDSTASGTAPMPIWSVAPSGMREATLRAIRRWTSLAGSAVISGRGWLTSTILWISEMWRNVWPWVRGMLGLTSAMTRRACRAAVRVVSTPTPRLK